MTGFDGLKSKRTLMDAIIQLKSFCLSNNFDVNVLAMKIQTAIELLFVKYISATLLTFLDDLKDNPNVLTWDWLKEILYVSGKYLKLLDVTCTVTVSGS